MTVFNALLLLGPTGAGKSPFGDHMEEVGVGSGRCCHFDFGEHLRGAAADPNAYPSLGAEALAVIRNVLDTGALLENHQFEIVETLFGEFAERRGMNASDWVLLNGMPRHVGQAEGVKRFAEVKIVVSLACEEALVYQRIATNAGGDRTHREDDQREAVKNKLRIFNERTMPLVAHYRGAGARVIEVPVGLDTRPREIAAALPAL